MNPGTSLHFDGKALEEQEEAELKQEDLRREQELRELLTTALPDDLLDDDTASFSSHDSSGSLSERHGRLHQSLTPSPDPWVHLQKQLPGHHNLIQQHRQLQQQTSTPNGLAQPPPLKTPGPMSQQNGYGDRRGNEQHFDQPETANYHTNHLQNGQQFTDSSDEETLGQYYEQREVEGAASDEAPAQRRGSEADHHFPGHGHVPDRGNQQTFGSGEPAQNHPRAFHGSQAMTNGYQDEAGHGDYEIPGYANEVPVPNEQFDRRYTTGGQIAGHGDYENEEQPYSRQVQQYSPSQPHTQQYSVNRPQVPAGTSTHQGQQTYLREAHPQEDPRMNGNNAPVHRVQYRGDGNANTNHQANGGSHLVTSQPTVGTIQQDAGDQLQKQFLSVVGDGETRQMAQLQILYKARGRELDQLKNQLQILQEETGREKRILNHQLALAQGERAGAAASYDQCQQLLVEAQQDNTTLKGQLQAQQAQMQALTAAKLEVEEKLQSTESAIESLTGQLTELQRSQPLARARDQQDGLLKSLQERYQQELVRLQEKADISERTLQEKSEEIASVRQELAKVSRASDQAKLEQGNTINTLTSQLQLSQKQCRDLLETGSLQEINVLRAQLQEAGAARTVSQDMTSALQEELAELKEQLQMYEAAVELGAMPAKSPDTAHSSRSFAVRNLAKSDWKTPQSQGPSSDSTPNMTPDDLIQGLRRELDRSLQSNRAKRTQVSKLQNDLRSSKIETETQKNKLMESETLAKDKEVRLKVLEAQMESAKSSSSSDASTPQGASTRQLQEQLSKVQKERDDLSKRLEAVQAEEARLNEANGDLKKQMAQMVSEWDQDKKIDLDRVQKTCLQLHEDSSRHMREELVAEFQSERDMLKEAHQHQLQELRSELEQSQKELDEAKGLYVDVCAEKNTIEDTVTKRLTADAAKQVEMAKEACQAQHDEALQELRETLESSHRASLVTAKNTWRQEAEEEKARTLKEDTKSTLKAAEAEWKVKSETELEQRLHQAKEVLEASHRDHLAKQNEDLKADHVLDKAEAVRTALSKAKTEWKLTTEATTKEKMKRAIEMAREQWLLEDSDKQTEEAIALAKRQWTKEQVDWDQVKKEWMEEDGEEEIAKRVAEKTRMLEAKHLRDIANLQGFLEKGRQELKQEMEAEKLTALQDVKRQLETAHQERLAEALVTVKAEAEKEKSQCLDRASSEWKSKLDKMVTEQQEAINQGVQKAQDQWLQEKQKLLEDHKKKLASHQGEAAAYQEELQTQYETELERGIEQAVKSAREQWSQNCDNELRKACDEILERKEQVWQQERTDLQEQLSDTASQLRDGQRQAERHRKKHALYRQKLEKEIESLKEQLQDADREMKQTEFNLRRELEHLQSRLKGANLASIEVLEAKMESMQRRHEAELNAAKQQRYDRGITANANTQTINSEDGVTSDALQEIKAHYVRTVKKIKMDVMKRMGDMRENCRHTVHTEVMKERQQTAKKLRRYYLECLQQFLEEDQAKSGNDHTKAQSAASKLAAMAKALELPPDQLSVDAPQVAASRRIAQLSTGTSRSREHSRSPSLCTMSEGTITDGSRNGSPVEARRPAQDGSQWGPDRRRVPQGASALAGRVNGCIKTDEDKIATPQSSFEGAGHQGSPPPVSRMSSDSFGDGINSQKTDELGSSSSGASWEETDTGITLSKLPIRPREFNPKPERLPSNSRSKPSSTSRKTLPSSIANVTVRSRESSPDAPGSGKGKSDVISGRLHHTESQHERSLKSRDNSLSGSPVNLDNRGQRRTKDGLSRISTRRPSRDYRYVNVDSPGTSPESPRGGSSMGSKRIKTADYPLASKSHSNVATRVQRSEQSPTVSPEFGKTSQTSPFLRPISRQRAESRTGPVKVPPATGKTAAMLASLPANIPKPVPQSTRHTQIPSPGPCKATDTSTASLDTVYNDLPASLASMSDFPLDNPPGLPLDKVVRFEDLAMGGVLGKGKTDLESIQTKLGNFPSSRRTLAASSLPSSKPTNLSSRGPPLRSCDKLMYMLQQDSGFVSPQTEEHIDV